MRAMSLAVLTALLAASLLAGCATTASNPAAMGATPYQANQGALGLRAEDDLAFSAGNPFRLLALATYPIGVFLQRVFEAPYAVAVLIDPTLYGINESEQAYLAQRWNVRAGGGADAPAAEPAPK
jgi:hypothetical protein